MIRPARFRALCASLGEVEERPHFDRAAFRSAARIFATLGPTGAEVNVLLPRELQDVLVTNDPATFARLNGAWGARGWTRMALTNVDEATCREVLREAYALAEAAPTASRRRAKSNAASAKTKKAATTSKTHARRTR